MRLFRSHKAFPKKKERRKERKKKRKKRADFDLVLLKRKVSSFLLLDSRSAYLPDPVDNAFPSSNALLISLLPSTTSAKHAHLLSFTPLYSFAPLRLDKIGNPSRMGH